MSGQPSAPSYGVRLLRGITALATLLGLLVDVPAILYAAGADPLPRQMPSLHSIGHTLIVSDTGGHLFISVTLVVAWLAWLAFSLSVLLELVGRLRNRPPMRIPGLAVPQRAAAGLLTAVALMLGSGGLATSAFAAAPAPTPIVRVIGGANAVARPATHAAIGGLVYHVRQGDQLGSIAQRFFGSFDSYHRIEAMNSGLILHGPDHIEAGWQLHLPAGARDRGALQHAAGTTSPATTLPPVAKPGQSQPGQAAPHQRAPGHVSPAPVHTPPGQADPGVVAPSQADQVQPTFVFGPVSAAPSMPAAPSPAAQVPDPVTTPAERPAPTQPAAASADAEPLVTFGDAEPIPVAAPATSMPPGGHSSSPELLLAASVLSVGVLGAHLLIWRRRRRELTHRGGIDASRERIPAPEPDAEALTGSSAEFNRLDLALRDLASLLSGRPLDEMPDIMGSWLVDNAVHLMLTKPSAAPPAPWIANGLMWTLPADARTNTWFGDVAAPMPALVTVGGQTDNRVLLDLERLGVVSIGGDSRGANDLLRHIGAELCNGIWSEDVTIGIAGFNAEDTRRLVALGEGRVHASASVSEALDGAGRWIGEAHQRMSGLGVADILSGRVSSSPTEAARLCPYALLLAGPDAQNLERLERLDTYLAGLGRGQIAIATSTDRPLGRFPITVDKDRQVTVEFLAARLPAASLDGRELATLAATPDAVRRNAGPMALDAPAGRHRTNSRMPVS